MILQQNIFFCGVCGRTITISREVVPWEDPVVTVPQGGWGYIKAGLRKEKEVLVCGECGPETPLLRGEQL